MTQDLSHGDLFENYDRMFGHSGPVIGLSGSGATAIITFVAPIDLDLVAAYYNPLTAGTNAASESTLSIGTEVDTPGVSGGAADTDYFSSYVSIPAGASILIGDLYRFGIIRSRILAGMSLTQTHVQLTNGGTGYISLLLGIPRVD